RRPHDPRLRSDRPRRRPGRPPRPRVGGARRAARRSADPRRRVHGGVGSDALPAARRQRGAVPAARPPCPGTRRAVAHHPVGGGGVAVGGPSGGRGRRDRQRPHRPVPPAGDDRRGRAPAGRDHRRPRRVRRLRRIQGSPGRAPGRHPLPGGARPPRRFGDGLRSDQRPRPGEGMSSSSGHLYGVGLGPGDPELITRKAARLIAEADVVAYYSGTHGRSIARSIAADLIPEGVVEERLVYPVTTGTTDHPGGYEGAIAEFYDDSARRLAEHLERGRDVVVLCEGDPLFYGSYMYLHDRLALRFPAEVVPGVTSVSAASAAVARPLVRRTDV